ncbi:hypothetical protein HMPREF0204_10861 [Chryseobacterium gleum ATCC 35910]|uniref:Uncharacterized protein n=1 Tax=Chryseobacterium gleum ATCC 35910 TaxID=525257 RepID=A0ABP2IZZ1_CHRGE|nr:hypothetical protein HMPREF0204_10861 [Chryseobacterium gleum ATCC 35910]
MIHSFCFISAKLEAQCAMFLRSKKEDKKGGKVKSSIKGND